MIVRGSTVRWARIQAVRVDGRYPVADVVDSAGGVWRGVRWLSLGGGAGRYLRAPGRPEEGDAQTSTAGVGAEVVLLFAEGRRHPWILAAAQHADDADDVTEAEAPETTADYDAHDVADIVVAVDGAEVSVGALAGITLRAGPSGQPVRVQLPGGSVLRVSIEGEATETVPLAGALRAYLDGLAAQVEAIRRGLINVENWARASVPDLILAPQGFAAPDLVGADPDTLLQQSLATWNGEGAGGAAEDIENDVDPGEVAPSGAYGPTTAALEAAAVAISARSRLAQSRAFYDFVYKVVDGPRGGA